jgi:cytochrome oxidase Cu insertion factor (SCO1/SenC/PrrC family)/DNA-binding beta-propeller fold protein YncE
MAVTTVAVARQSSSDSPTPASDQVRDAASQRLTANGVVVDFSMHRVGVTSASPDQPARPQQPTVVPPDPAAGPTRFRDGDDVVFRFAMRDTTSGAPLTGARPAAWMDRRPPAGQPDPACKTKIQDLLSGSIFRRAELDLNVYYVLALNEDATITVVDPLFGFGQTRLLALVTLRSPGEDWVLTDDRTRLFVSMPDANQVAVVDTTSWRVSASLDVASRPVRLALQPDQQYLWVSYEGGQGSGDAGGVEVFSTTTLKPAARIPTGRGPHAIAVSDDNRFAVVANHGAGTASLLDIRRLAKIADLPVGAGPSAVAFSALSRLAYITTAGDGTIVAVDPNRTAIVARMTDEPGLTRIRFARNGRFGFVVNPERDRVAVIDAASNRIIQTGRVDDGPDQLAISEGIVYVLHRGSEIVRMIPLDEVGREGQPLQIADFPGGQAPFGRGSRPSVADRVVEAPGGNAVLVANPADQAIYFYKEGMAAPMGHFKNYGREPRAALVVDRSLRERSPGVYETEMRLQRAGSYDVAFFLSSPQVVHCFPVTVDAGPNRSTDRHGPGLEVVGQAQQPELRVGERADVRFQLIDPDTRQPVSGLADVRAMAVLAPGLWQERTRARARDNGVYEVDLTPPKPGLYYMYVESRSRSLSFTESRPLMLQAVSPGKTGSPEETHAQHAHSAASSPPPGAAEGPVWSPLSTPIPDVPLLDQDGRRVRFHSDLVKDRIVAINTIFTTCTTVCPPLGATFARLQQRLGQGGEPDVRLISISVDPVTDTPARLKAWAATFDARPGWTLVTGAKQEVDRLLKALGLFTADKAAHAPVTLIGSDAAGQWTRAFGLTSVDTLAGLIERWPRAPRVPQIPK